MVSAHGEEKRMTYWQLCADHPWVAFGVTIVIGLTIVLSVEGLSGAIAKAFSNRR
jgi:hypothetical protein